MMEPGDVQQMRPDSPDIMPSQSSKSSSSRKPFPAMPAAMPTQPSPASRMSSAADDHALRQFFLEYSLMAEYNKLKDQRLPGVYVMPSATSALTWHGVLFIRQGLYQEGIFKFTLLIPEDFPDGNCPRLMFSESIFHPLIHPETNELDVRRAFPKWRRVDHLWQVLLYARRVFYKIETSSPWNEDAALVYNQDIDVYKKKAAQTVQLCKDKMYDSPATDDPHAIRFSPWDQEKHEEARKQLFQPKVTATDEDGGEFPASMGLSWMKSGPPIFSKDDSASG